MNNQNKKSFIQVLTKEYKIVMLYSFIILFIPVVTQSVLISDLVMINNLSFEGLVGLLYGTTDLNIQSMQVISKLGIVVNLIAVPLFAAVFARKLNGQRLKHALRDAFKDLKTKRFWNYIIKVYVPTGLVLILTGFITKLISEPLRELALTSNALSIIFAILIIIISVILFTIIGMIFISNITYLRGSNRIKEALQLVPNREVIKLVLFNALELIVLTCVVLMFVVPVLSMEIMELLSGLVSILIGFFSTILVLQIIFTYIRVNLYMNIASKIEVKF